MKNTFILFLALVVSAFAASTTPIKNPVFSGTISGITAADVNATPLTTYAAFASNAVTLGHDGIVYQGSPVATVPLTLSSGGSAGDERSYEFYFATAQTVTTDFAVYRNWATASANISKSYVGKVTITIRNMGSGEYRWYDNDYGSGDLPAGALANGMTATTQSPGDNSTKLATTAYTDAAVAAVGSGTGLSAYSHFVFPTALLGSKPANTIVADATGATNSGTLDLMTSDAVTSGTWLMQGNGTVTTPTSSLAAGSYVGTQNITVTEQSGADTRVTQNGVDPVRSDTLVSGTVAVTTTGTVKLRSFLDGYAPSTVSAYAYTITAPASYVYSNHLEFANNAAATSAGFTLAGSPSMYYVTAPAPITGRTSSAKTVWGDSFAKSFTAIVGESWFCVKVNPVSVGTSAEGFLIMNGATKLAQLAFGTSSTLTLTGGAAGPSATTTYTVGEEIYLKVRYVPGTGFNSTVVVYIAPVSTGIFGAAKITMTTGKGTLNADTIKLGPSNNQILIWNDLIVSDTDMGDSPVVP